MLVIHHNEGTSATLLRHKMIVRVWRHNMIATVVATISAIWQRRAADCTRTPQSPKSEKSPFTSYSSLHRERYIGGFSGTIARANRAQSACQGPNNQQGAQISKQPGFPPPESAVVVQSDTHLKTMMPRTDATLSQILVEPESKRMRLVRLTITFEPQ